MTENLLKKKRAFLPPGRRARKDTNKSRKERVLLHCPIAENENEWTYFLVRPANEHRRLDAIPADQSDALFDPVRIPIRIDDEPQALHLLDDFGTQLGAIFADAAGEDQSVNMSIELHKEIPHVARDPIDQDVDGEGALGRGGLLCHDL